jgi:predicted PurR-regulated permease PerM
MPFFWAVVLAIVLYPLYQKIHTSIKSERLASLFTILILCAVLIAPVSIIGALVSDEASDLYGHFSDSRSVQQFLAPLNPLFVQFDISPDDLEMYISQYGKVVTASIAEHAITYGKATLVGFFKLLIMLYLLFFMLKDGKRMLRFLQFHLPLGDAKETHLFNTFASITRALFKGTIAVAAAQALVCGFLFLITGVPHVMILTTLALLLACIPGVGPTIVWGPVVLWLFLTGNVLGACIVLAGGLIVVSLIDNILRPLLVGRETALPDPLILLSILGGIATFGISGLIIGPVSAGLALALLQMFREQYGTDLELHG